MQANVQLNVQSRIASKIDHTSKMLTVLLGFLIPISTSLSNIILFCMVFTWFLAGDLRSKADTLFRHPITPPVLIFYAIFVLASFYSEVPWHDRLEALWKMSKVLYIPFLLPLLRESIWRKRACLAFLAAMALTLVLGILRMYADVPIPSRYTLACVFKNHIDTNFMMAVAAFFMGHIVLDIKASIQEKSANTKNYAWFLLACLTLALMCFYVLCMSEGRSGYIIFAFLWVLFFLQRFRVKHLVLAGLCLCLLLSLVMMGSDRFKMRFDSAIEDVMQYQLGKTETPFGARLEYITQTWQLVKQHPWLGLGTGSFKKTYEKNAIQNNLKITTNPHNEYLNILLQVGFLGLTSFFVLFWSLFKQSIYLASPERYWVQGLSLSMMIGCVGNSWLMDFTSGYFFVIMSSICLSAFRVVRKPASTKMFNRDLIVNGRKANAHE